MKLNLENGFKLNYKLNVIFLKVILLYFINFNGYIKYVYIILVLINNFNKKLICKNRNWNIFYWML